MKSLVIAFTFTLAIILGTSVNTFACSTSCTHATCSEVANEKGEKEANAAVTLESTVTCPKCGHEEKLTMKTNSCRFFHKCSGCSETIKAKEGDCCVFSSYGNVTCPTKQMQK